MANRGSIRTSVLMLVSNSTMIAASDVNTLIDGEHITILEDNSWLTRRAESVLTTVAPYSTGTVSTSGTTVTGVSTVFTSAMVGRFIRIGTNPYFSRITGFTSAMVLTIEAALPTDAAAGSTYVMFKHQYALPSNYGRLLDATLDTRLTEWPVADINRADPYRSSTASYPDIYALVGPDSDNLYQIELWPVPSAAAQVRVSYLRLNTLSSDSDSPLYRSDVLVWKTAESACYFLYGKTGDQAWLGLGDRYHARYVEALDGAKAEDLGRWSPPFHLRDIGRTAGFGSDFWLNRDDLFLR